MLTSWCWGLFSTEAITRCLSELEAGQFGMGDSARKDCNSQAAGSGLPNYVYNYCYQRAIQRINYCSITPNCRGFNKQSSKLSHWVHSVANITEWPICKQTIHLLCIRIRTNTYNSRQYTLMLNTWSLQHISCVYFCLIMLSAASKHTKLALKQTSSLFYKIKTDYG